MDGRRMPFVQRSALVCDFLEENTYEDAGCTGFIIRDSVIYAGDIVSNLRSVCARLGYVADANAVDNINVDA